MSSRTLSQERAALKRMSHLRPAHWAVLAMSLLLTFIAWEFSKSQIESRKQARYDAAVTQIPELIKERMHKYEDALWSGVSAIQSHGGEISYRDWQVFSESLNVDQKYPGINGIGVINPVTPKNLDEYLSFQRIERPDFRIHPSHNNSQYLPITFIEPQTSNAAAVGLDMAHETNRFTSALKSRDTGLAQITGPIVLVQDANKTPGFLFFAPYYRGPATNQLQRQDNFAGLVYAPFIVSRLMSGVLQTDLRQIRIRITDGDTVIYDEHESLDAIVDDNPVFESDVVLNLYGRVWDLHFRTNLDFRLENTYAQPSIILMGGLLIDVLLLALFTSLTRANRRAVHFADATSDALEKESAKLKSTNRDLEHFAYIASHDLKTPVRGIGALTEMVEEDLQDYLSKPDTRPEVAENLVRIKSRVRRMNSLIKGILDYSQVGNLDSEDDVLMLGELCKEISIDLRLAPGTVKVSGETTKIEVDASLFRRVIENLIGNAVKYHDAKAPLEIEVSADTQLESYTGFTVTDNGPGIDPVYHEKVFDPFKALENPTDVESTGIGLSIVKKAVESHGGSIILLSSVGNGATFSFTWPNGTSVPSELAAE